MGGLPLVAASGGHFSSRCAGLSLSRPLLLQSTGSRRAGSVVVVQGLSCSAACGIFPEPMCPELAGRFLTTAPPGKPYNKKYVLGLYPVSGTELLKLLEFPAMRVITISFVMLMRWVLVEVPMQGDWLLGELTM